MANYKQPNTDPPVLDPGVASYPLKIHKSMIAGPVWPGNTQQPNTANPVVDPRVGVFRLNLNPMGL